MKWQEWHRGYTEDVTWQQAGQRDVLPDTWPERLRASTSSESPERPPDRAADAMWDPGGPELGEVAGENQ